MHFKLYLALYSIYYTLYMAEYTMCFILYIVLYSMYCTLSRHLWYAFDNIDGKVLFLACDFIEN